MASPALTLTDDMRCRLLQLYKTFPILWDTKHRDFKNSRERAKAIGKIVENSDIKGLTQRKATLFFRSMRRDYYSKLAQGLLTDEYLSKSRWKWLKIAHTFLNAENAPNKLVSVLITACAYSTENEKNTEILTYYKEEELLWNPKLPLYKNRVSREAAWNRCLAKIQIEDMTLDDYRVKIKNLRSIYHQKRKQLARESLATYSPELTWFHLMDSFLGPVLFPEGNEQQPITAQRNGGDDQEKYLRAIECYQQESVLWNPSDPSYYSRIAQEAAWERCVDEFQREGVYRPEFQRLVKNLLAKYTRQRQRIHSSDLAAYCPDLKWFHLVESLLGPIIFENEDNQFSDMSDEEEATNDCLVNGPSLEIEESTDSYKEVIIYESDGSHIQTTLETMTANISLQINDSERSKLIELYKEYPILWDAAHPDHKNPAERKTAIAEIVELVQIDGLTPKGGFLYLEHMVREYCTKMSQGLLTSEYLSHKKWQWLRIASTFLRADHILVKQETSDSDENFTILTNYKQEEVLWNPSHSEYENSDSREAAWNRCLAQVQPETMMTVYDLKIKIEQMLATYQQERSGLNAESLQEYCPDLKWFHLMESFLGPIMFAESSNVTTVQFPNFEGDNVRNLHALELYKEQTVLWDPSHPQFGNKSYCRAAWERCVEQWQLTDITRNEFQRLVRELQAKYTQQRHQLHPDEVATFQSELSWFQLADSFLGPIIFPEDYPQLEDDQNTEHNASEAVELSEEEEECPDSGDMESSGADDIEIAKHKTDQMRLRLIKLYEKYPILWDHAHPHFKNESEQNLAWKNLATESQSKIGSGSRSKQEIKYLDNLYLELRKKLTAEEIRADDELPKWFYVADAFLGPSMVEDDGQKPFLKNLNSEDLILTCRACLTDCANDEEQIKYLSSTRSFTGGATLNELYNELVGFRFDAESKLPTGICKFCEQILLKFSDFREKCHANEQEFLARIEEIHEIEDDQLQEVETTEDYAFEVLEEFDLNNENNDSIEPPVVTPSTEISQQPQQEKVDQDHQKFIINVFQCDLCKKVYNKKEFLISHLKLIHEQKNALKREHSDYSCTLCESSFKKKVLLSSHLKYVHGKVSEHIKLEPKRRKVKEKLPKTRTVCHICGEERSTTGMKAHLDSHKSNMDRYQCHLCVKNYKMLDALKIHIKIKHQGRTYNCQYCDLVFTSWGGRVIHTHLKHYNPKAELSCEYCDRQFPSELTLKRHRRIIHTNSERTFKCGECGTTCASNMILKAHKQTKHAGQKYACDVCSKVFNSQRFLRSHSLIHTGEKNYECPVCANLFSQNSLLRTHVAKIHPSYKLPPKGTILNLKARKKMAQREQMEKSLVKVDFVE